MTESKTYTLTIRSIPSAVPTDVRLANLLKKLLRAYGFKAIDYREIGITSALPAIPGTGQQSDAGDMRKDAPKRGAGVADRKPQQKQTNRAGNPQSPANEIEVF